MSWDPTNLGTAVRSNTRFKRLTNSEGSAVFAIAHLALGSLSGYIANQKLWDIAGGWRIRRTLYVAHTEEYLSYLRDNASMG